MTSHDLYILMNGWHKILGREVSGGRGVRTLTKGQMSTEIIEWEDPTVQRLGGSKGRKSVDRSSLQSLPQPNPSLSHTVNQIQAT